MALVVQPFGAARPPGGDLTAVTRPRRRAAAAVVAIAAVVIGSCADAPTPIDVRTGDTCAYCRMAVSDTRFAGQIAAPGQEPLVYDDIGCLAHAVAGGKPLEYAWVADHRTREWVPASRAVFTQVPGLATPMASHLVAHATEESRKADAAASGGRAMASAEVFSHAH